MSDKFTRATGGTFVTLVEGKTQKNGEPSKSRFIGNHIVGILLKSEPGTLPNSLNHTIHLYEDPTDESKFGQEPDGEIVILGGSTVINGAFETHKIGPGACVEIKYLGQKKGASGTGYENYDVGFFYPAATFKKASAAPVKSDEDDEDAEPFPSKVKKEDTVTKPVAKKKKPVVEEAEESTDDEDVEEDAEEGEDISDMDLD